ncbi:MAG TPA: hypothetical protein EYP58_01465 [bacterium (Candidatus Stahlbacteria)]|nr:hypothetical protein [Candidatus Stahlbacteria bacterium]
MVNLPIIDSLIRKDLEYQVYPRHPVLSLAFKTSGGDLNLARQFDPYSPDVIFYNFINAVANRHFSHLPLIFDDFRNYLKDFYFQLFIIGNVLLLIYLTVFLAGIAFFLILLFRYLPVYIHNLGEFLPVPEIFKYIIAAILILPLLFITRNLFIIAIVSVAPLYLFATRFERRWIRFFVIWILLSFPVSYITNSIVITLKGENTAGIIYRNLKIEFDPRIDHIRETNAVFANAYVSNLQGEWQKAESLYLKLIHTGSDDFMYYNNLGNIRFQLGELYSAESLYLIAAQKSHRSGIPFQNLGNLYLKQLRFLESSRNFKIARERSAPQLDKIIDFKPVESSLWSNVFMLDLRFPLIFSPYIVLFAVIIYLLGFVIAPVSTINFCSLCGAPISKETRISDEQRSYCKNCGIKLQTARDDKTKTRILKQIQDRSDLWTRIRGVIFTIILPGFVQIYFGRILKGFLLSLLPLFSYMLIYLARPPLVSPFWQTPDLSPLLIRAFIPIIVGCMIIALIGVLSYGSRRTS